MGLPTRTRINLICHGRPLIPSSVSFLVLRILSCYVCAWAVLSVLPRGVRLEGVLDLPRAVPAWLAAKEQSLSEHMNERTLAANFLANDRGLSFSEALHFSASGLTHLLAISGGQIAPLASAAGAIGAWFAFIFARPFLPLARLMAALAVVRAGMGAASAFGVAALFGNTGALMRVGVLTYVSAFPFVRTCAHALCQTRLTPTFDCSLRLLMLAFLVVVSGDPFLNPSFLLSALGASVASVCTAAVSAAARAHTPTRRFAILTWKASVGVMNQAVTTLVITGVLSPLIEVDVLNSVIANVLGFPLVTFLITPVSLLTLAVPEGTRLSARLLDILDTLLSTLKRLAFTFSEDPAPGTNPFAQSKRLFSDQGMAYLALVLIALWVIRDAWPLVGRRALLGRQKNPP